MALSIRDQKALEDDVRRRRRQAALVERLNHRRSVHEMSPKDPGKSCVRHGFAGGDGMLLA